MGELIDLEIRRARKELKEYTNSKGIAYEIYLTVVKYINEHLDEGYKKPVENLTTETLLELVYQGDRERFKATFQELMHYWKLDVDMEDVQSLEGIFTTFKTVGDLCIYLEKKVNKRSDKEGK
ncbi:hypothetical protein GLW08_02925 [Pontibacillus yanchengensis]|uniref:Uncharacterized protein n=2 Tax=Pontibacillus yanchengensis TaxID=462910 RepID=A0A6I5A1G3_9BACI|nr:hypothetical protein [Pontibacillus yanchengensis]MYL34727.1 hypothetical protein [Pontibacillus yanchengensis]MYL52287.1 hypothetical protein [Pontibacillus yanchengensis]